MEGLIFGGAMGGNLRFKIDWASLIAGSKFTVFALFYFVFEGNFPSTSPEGLLHGRAYFRNFTVYKKYRIQSKGVKNTLRSFWYTQHSGYFNDLFHF